MYTVVTIIILLACVIRAHGGSCFAVGENVVCKGDVQYVNIIGSTVINLLYCDCEKLEINCKLPCDIKVIYAKNEVTANQLCSQINKISSTIRIRIGNEHTYEQEKTRLFEDLTPEGVGVSQGYVFVIVSYLIGVFVFATIVGQVGNVITNRNASRQEFERLLDSAKSYMRMHSVPHELRKRVQRWYDYVWSRGRLNGSWDINALGILPDKLKTELALYVNLETLKKVTIFQECQPEFLHDLVLKMKAYIFTPGDLICRNSEVAREMFIIADGVVDVIGDTGTILTQMSTGDFFGEIGILNLDGGINRRTADVRSVGYSELFVLSRDDVLSALKDHPEAEKIIRDYGQKRLRQIEAHRQKIKLTDSPEPITLQPPSTMVRIFSRKNKRKVTDSHANHTESDGYVNKTAISKNTDTTGHNSTGSGGTGDSDGTNGGGIKGFFARTLSQRQKSRRSKPPQLPSRGETRSLKRPSVLRRAKDNRSSSQVEVALPRRGRRPGNVIPGVVDFCPSEADFCDDSNSSVYKHLLVPDIFDSDSKSTNCGVVTAEQVIPHSNEVTGGAFKGDGTLPRQDGQASRQASINKDDTLPDDSHSVFELADISNSIENTDKNTDIANAFIQHLVGSKTPKSPQPTVTCAPSTTICSKITCNYCKSLECNKLNNCGVNVPITYSPKHKRGKSVEAFAGAELPIPGQHTCDRPIEIQKRHAFPGLPIYFTPGYSSSCTEINTRVSRSGNTITSLLSPIERHGLLAGTSTRSDSAPSLNDCSMKSLLNIHNQPVNHTHPRDRQHPLSLYSSQATTPHHLGVRDQNVMVSHDTREMGALAEIKSSICDLKNTFEVHLTDLCHRYVSALNSVNRRLDENTRRINDLEQTISRRDSGAVHSDAAVDPGGG